MYTIEFTDSAIDDMQDFSKADKVRIHQTAEQQLSHEPLTPTRHRKALRPNDLSQWEVRVGSYRIFYDAYEASGSVIVKAVGMKRGNRLLIRGKEHRL